MGRRRRKAVRVLKKRLPEIFLCPRCGKETIAVKLLPREGRALVRCGGCGLSDELPALKPHKEIDVYCRFTDKYYSERKQRSEKA